MRVSKLETEVNNLKTEFGDLTETVSFIKDHAVLKNDLNELKIELKSEIRESRNEFMTRADSLTEITGRHEVCLTTLKNKVAVLEKSAA